MTGAIPPTWLNSIVQGHGAKTRAAEEKQKENAAQAEATGEGSFGNNLQDVIEASDRDSQVYSDAEGSGSQGRPSEEAVEEERNAAEGRDDATTDGGLDLQA